MIRPVGLILLAVLVPAAVARAQEATTQPLDPGSMLPDLGERGTASSMVKWLALATVVSVVPAIAVLVTSFTRIIVVLGLLRQGLGAHQLPPNTVLFGLALLATVARWRSMPMRSRRFRRAR